MEPTETHRAQFERDGYLALRGFFSAQRIDRVLGSVAELLATRGDEIVVDDLSTGQRVLWLELPGQASGRFKFNDLYLVSDAIRELALEPALGGLLAALLGEPVVLCNSLNFRQGSAQPKHIDSLFMTPRTPHALIATWTAFEDAHPDAGPLVYWPRSHTIPLYRFQDGSNRATTAELPAWTSYIDRQLHEHGLEPRTFLAKKGDVFIWHSDLIHGGSAIIDPAQTRNSLVCHYFTQSDCTAARNEITPCHQGFWLKRLRQPVKISPGRFGPARPFPETTYLARYPDVRSAVEAGTLASGWVHYQQHGYAEGRGI